MCNTIESCQNYFCQIRRDIIASMNGVISDSMQEKGMNYRLNYGVDIPQLRKIARKYEPDPSLAEQLWVDDVRESKILATLLYPSTVFSKQMAEKWVQEIPTQEIREQVCRNLFQNLSFADELVQEWSSQKETNIRITGYWLLARLYIIGATQITEINATPILENAVNDLRTSSMLLRQAALNVLRYFGRCSQENATDVLHRVVSFERSFNAIEREMYEMLKFEFEVSGLNLPYPYTP